MSKDSFVIVREQRPAFDCLSDEDAGKLIKAVLAYQFDGVEPVLPPVPQMAFAMMKPVFERFAAKYEETCRKRREAGAKGGKAKAANASKCQPEQANVANASNAKQSLHDRDRDPDREERKEHTHDGSLGSCAPADSQGACVSPAPLNGEDIAERQDAAQAQHRRGDYEFSLVREAYNNAREEGELSGRQEFLSLYNSKAYPGHDEIIAGINRLCEQDDQFQRGFAPSLGKFLSQRMWSMKPRAPVGHGEQQETADEKARRESFLARQKAYLDDLKARKEAAQRR